MNECVQIFRAEGLRPLCRGYKKSACRVSLTRVLIVNVSCGARTIFCRLRHYLCKSITTIQQAKSVQSVCYNLMCQTLALRSLITSLMLYNVVLCSLSVRLVLVFNALALSRAPLKYMNHPP